mmetsp:Transcript_14055/g.16770  ORF Transcript_14055/g.16770 Transcript_14055/m.16770 type:complete len:89 (+) Transcript_14055:178-444(+)
MYRRLGKVVVPIGIFYLMVNFVTTKMSGNVTYWFLSWKDPLVSGCAVVIGLGGALAFIYLLAIASELAKQRKLPDETQDSQQASEKTE